MFDLRRIARLSPSRAALALSLLGVAGCAAIQAERGTPSFDGHIFRASAQAESRANQAAFTVTVRGVSNSRLGAGLAADHEAKEHCLRFFGTSDIVWDVPPDDEALPVEDDRLVVSGTCVPVAR